MPPDGSAPPDDRRTTAPRSLRWRSILGLAAAVAVAAAVLAVAWNLDRGESGRRESRLDRLDIADLASPDPLTAEERASLGEGGGVELSNPSGVALAEGGWIEVADEDGRLKQRYAASRMDPRPDGWVEMVEPRAIVFGRQGQVTTLEGREGTARLADRELESGTLEEDVRIRFFRPEEGRTISIEHDPPWLVVEAESADFDGGEGRIRCDGPVSIVSPELEFAGVNLLVLLDPDGRDVEQLLVERATAPLRLRPRSREEMPTASDATGDEPDGAPADEAAPPANVPRDRSGDPSAEPAPETGTDVATDSGADSAANSRSGPETPRFMRLVLDGGVEVRRRQGSNRLSIEGDRLAAIFAMESGGWSSLAIASPSPHPTTPTPLHPHAWLAVSALAGATSNDETESPDVADPAESAASGWAGPAPASIESAPSDELVEIDFGGSLRLEPIEPATPVPNSPEEVWVRIDGREVRIHDEVRDARIRCDLVDLRSGGTDGDRVDLLARRGSVRIEAPGLRLNAPAVRVRGPRVLVAGPGAMDLISEDRPDASEDTAEPPVAERVELAWADRLDLTLSEDDRLRRAIFEGGDDGRVTVRSSTLAVDADSLDVVFLEASSTGTAAIDDDRIDRIRAEGRVSARRPGGGARLDAARLLVEMRQDADAARPGRILAEQGVRAFDAARVLWADRLDATLAPGIPANEADPGAEPPPTSRAEIAAGTSGDEIESVEAGGGVVAGLADGTWVFADGFTARPREGRLALEGEDVAIVRDGAMLDGLRGLALLEDDGRVEATTDGPGRLQAARSGLLTPWTPPAEGASAAWVWPVAPSRPRLPEELALAAVWEGGLRYLESRLATSPGVEVASLEVDDRVRARTVGEDGIEDRLAATRLRVGFVREPVAVATEASDAAPAASEGGEVASLEVASMDLEGGASLERRRWSGGTEGAARPDLLRITGERIAYVVATGEGRVPGAGTLLVAEAATAEREARTARFRWTERLDLARRGDAETAVAISGEVELAFAGGDAASAFTLTADRMDAILRPRASAPTDGDAVPETTGPGDLDRLELRAVDGAGRVFARGRGRDVECDAFDYDADTGMLVLSARPGRSVSVMTTTAAAPMRAERVRWNLRTDRVEIESARGEG